MPTRFESIFLNYTRLRQRLQRPFVQCSTKLKEINHWIMKTQRNNICILLSEKNLNS